MTIITEITSDVERMHKDLKEIVEWALKIRAFFDENPKIEKKFQEFKISK